MKRTCYVYVKAVAGGQDIIFKEPLRYDDDCSPTDEEKIRSAKQLIAKRNPGVENIRAFSIEEVLFQ